MRDVHQGHDVLTITGRRDRLGALVRTVLVLIFAITAVSARCGNSDSYIDQKDGAIFTNPAITLTGDMQKARVVELRLNGGNWDWVVGDPKWTRPYVLNNGLNTLELRAYIQVGGAPKPIKSYKFYYPKPSVSIPDLQTNEQVLSTPASIRLHHDFLTIDPIVTTAFRVNGGAWNILSGAPNSINVNPDPGSNRLEIETRTNRGLNSNIASVTFISPANSSIPFVKFSTATDIFEIYRLPAIFAGTAGAGQGGGSIQSVNIYSSINNRTELAQGNENWTYLYNQNRGAGQASLFASAVDAAARVSGVDIIDTSVSQHLNTIPRGTFYLNETAYSIDVQTSVTYLACGSDGLRILDIRNPDQPTTLSQLRTPDNEQGSFSVRVRVRDGLAYELVAGQLNIVDVSDPSHPNLRSIYARNVAISDVLPLANHRALLLTPNYPQFPTNVILLDASDSANPVSVNETIIDYFLYSFVDTGSSIYAIARWSNGDGRTASIDFPTPNTIRATTQNYNSADFGMNNRAYGAGQSSLYVDGRKSSLVLTNFHRISGNKTDMLWGSDLQAGLVALDAGKPADPPLVGIAGIPADQIGANGDLAVSTSGHLLSITQYVGPNSRRPVVVNLPAAGARIAPGASIIVAWQTNEAAAGTAVNISLWRNGAKIASLADDFSVNCFNTLPVPIPSNAPVGTGYSIRVSSNYDSNLHADSPLFTVAK